MNAIEQESADGTTLIRLRGEVDLSWSQQVRKAVLDALTSSSRVGVDLAEVGYIDSSGIAALVEGFQQARTQGRGFALVAVSDAVRSVLELARLDRVFPLVDEVGAIPAVTAAPAWKP
ncbi:MAG TPA: STAS domain-containing protein [Dokdonella sp.]|uniref:STAS domain-containing protein n=1 Tax=Dokdonella sp. TaxID=2291710 RepID=UPI0025C64A9E|nr:STAS domain-containing protein [Dokdonella sp.]MBX3692226.1 STAS domain-containing protein [Dokdonella sp.]HNR90905.1 STAS domain-containing protein [Dokdonella sp.]